MASVASLQLARPAVASRAVQARECFRPAAGCTARVSRAMQMGRKARGTGRGALQVVAGRVENEDVALGFKAPDFELSEPLTGKTIKLSEYASGAPATLVMFLCNHCPFVVHLKAGITELAKEYQAKGVAVVAISSNSAETHPKDGPEKMAEDAAAQGYTFPYLFDETQDVAKAYSAACTPEFYVFDAGMALTYHGQFDDSRPASKGGNGLPVTGEDLRHALDCTLAGKPVERLVRPSIGCNIKWAPGKAPAWYHG